MTAEEMQNTVEAMMEQADRMAAACGILQKNGYECSFEYPGYIDVGTVPWTCNKPISFAFGDGSGDCYTYDYSPDPNEVGIREGGRSTLSLDATAEEIAAWVNFVLTTLHNKA